MEKLAFAIYMTVLVIGVLLFGAVHTYAYTLMEIGVLGASLLVVADMVRLDGGRRVIRISQNPFLLGFFSDCGCLADSDAAGIQQRSDCLVFAAERCGI